MPPSLYTMGDLRDAIGGVLYALLPNGAELLVKEIASDRSILFSPAGQGRPCLENNPEPARLPPVSEDDQPEPEPSPT